MAMNTNYYYVEGSASSSGSSKRGDLCSSPVSSPHPLSNSVPQVATHLSYARSGTVTGPGCQRSMPHRNATAPPATGYNVAGKHIPGRNLTGKVRKMSDYYFAAGGFADVWEGQLVEEPEEDTPGVRISDIFSHFYRFVLGGTRFRVDVGDEGTNSKLKTVKVAVKILRNITIGVPEANKEQLAKRLAREALVWQGLSHPNITPFLGFSYDLSHTSVPSLVSPFYSNGNINSYLLKHSERPIVFKLIAQIGAGLAYLHNQSPVVVHGDIKGSNILIDDDGNARLADFGLSRVLESTGLTTKSIAGSCRWMASELMYSDDISTVDAFTTETDVWALGMTTLEILTGKLPFAEYRHDVGVILALSKGNRPERPIECDLITDSVWTLLQSTWDKDSDNRPSACMAGLVLDLLYISETIEGPRLTPAQVQLVLHKDDERKESCLQQNCEYWCKRPGCGMLFRRFEDCCKHEFSHYEPTPSTRPILQPALSTSPKRTRFRRKGNF